MAEPSAPFLRSGTPIEMRNFTSLTARHGHHLGLLLLWMAIATLLRWTNLTSKPLWTDEFATIVFSLGHSFQSVPLDQLISAEMLLQPLQITPRMGADAVVDRLLSESNHPPLYFLLTHYWLSLFAPNQEWEAVAAVRAIAALFGVVSIPAAFGLSRLALRSWPAAHFTAVLMALSPFGLYLSQEGRHYTLPILWIIASLACLVQAARAIQAHQSISWRLGLTWVVINGLGMATHYFFGLTLCAEAITLMGFILFQYRQGHRFPGSGRMAGVILGTAATGLVWLPFWHQIQGSELTRWIQLGQLTGFAWLNPLAQAFASWVTMLYMLPIQAPTPWMVYPSGLVMILLMLWTLPRLYQGIQHQTWPPHGRLALQMLAGFVISAIALFLGITYGFGMDLTSAFRYNFVYFPAVILLAGAGLAGCWTGPITPTAGQYRTPLERNPVHRQRWVVLLILGCSLMGSVTVLSNLGFQKAHRPDVVVQAIQATFPAPMLIAMPYRTHGQTGAMMGIAWELQRQLPLEYPSQPLFLLARESPSPQGTISTLNQTLAQLSRPLNLWLLNGQHLPQKALQTTLQQQGCPIDPQIDQAADGYRYQLYPCL